MFAERGYYAASIDEIARRWASPRRSSTTTSPRSWSSTAGSWSALATSCFKCGASSWLPAEQRIPRALDAWVRYVEGHPYAPRMFFHETTGDPEIRAVHREVQADAVAALGRILGGEPGAERIAGSADRQALEMAAEVIRSGLTGLAIWWTEHPEVPRERIVATAVNVIWLGFERVRRGETWAPGGAHG